MHGDKPHGVESPEVIESPPDTTIYKYRLLWKDCKEIYYQTNSLRLYIMKINSIKPILLKYLIQDPIIVK